MDSRILLMVLWMTLIPLSINEGNYEMPEEPVVSTEVTVVTPKYREVTMNVSAYTASDDECGKSDGITASGAKAVEGITVASDDLPFGTIVEIQGKDYVVQDRFGGGYRNRLDIFMVSRNSAEYFGRQRITVRVKETQQ